jgi:alpha-L-fucosidase
MTVPAKLINKLLLSLLCSTVAAAQYRPTEANLKARQWFQQARFGMFIHWGVYSVPARGEWVMENEKISVSQYEKFAPEFNPTQFDAAQWVSLAKRAGVRYITITSKHHDGFDMFATKRSRWNIVDATPYAKDPLAALAEECHKQGIKLFFYYSQLDWHHPDYFPLGLTGHAAGRPPGGDWNRYLDYMDAQLTELLTNYGPVGGIWFDGMWDKPDADWQLARTYSLIHSLQPAALIGSNHHLKPFDGEDFQMFEKDLPGLNTSGFSEKSEVGGLPLETCDTINDSWGFNAGDKKFKSAARLIQYLVRAAGYDANFLLNVGPTSSGAIPPEEVDRLEAMGKWLDKNGETIYGTRGGPAKPRPWGAMTQKGNQVYVHILNWSDELLALPEIGGVKSAKLFARNTPVDITPMNGGLVLRVPAAVRDPIDTIVVLQK